MSPELNGIYISGIIVTGDQDSFGYKGRSLYPTLHIVSAHLLVLPPSTAAQSEAPPGAAAMAADQKPSINSQAKASCRHGQPRSWHGPLFSLQLGLS